MVYEVYTSRGEGAGGEVVEKVSEVGNMSHARQVKADLEAAGEKVYVNPPVDPVDDDEDD